MSLGVYIFFIALLVVAIYIAFRLFEKYGR